MSARNFYHRYPSDAITGMQSLTLEERGAYNTLLDLIYDREGPIPDNPYILAGYMNCSVRKWKSLRQSLLEKGKIELTEDNRISNSRAFFELENRLKTSRKRSENVAKTPRKRAENQKFANDFNEGDSLPRTRAPACGLLPDTRDHIASLSASSAREAEIAKAMKAARFVVPPNDHHFVGEWLDLGLRIDQIETLLSQIADRQIERGNPPRMFKYFNQSIRTAAQNPESIPDHREWWEKTPMSQDELDWEKRWNALPDHLKMN